MKRIFVNIAGDANKFWTIEQLGNKYQVQWGKIGTEGRSLEKVFASAGECAEKMENLIAEKLGKGYVETADLAIIPDKPVSAYRPMDEVVFWEVIASLNWKKLGNDDAVLRPALNKLMSMPAEDIKQFAEILAEKLYALDGLAYASNIGPDSYKGKGEYFSADYFLYVRCCVVANGEDYYHYVLNNPKEMPKGLDFEPLLYLADNALNKKLKTEGETIETKVSVETFSNGRGWKG